MIISKCESAIIRHEKARAEVLLLKSNHSSLLSKCKGMHTHKDLNGFVFLSGKPCGAVAWDYMAEEVGDGCYVSFEDVFLNEINDGEGACSVCIEAFSLKHGALADARKEFGNAKRAISNIGKKLIKEVEL